MKRIMTSFMVAMTIIGVGCSNISQAKTNNTNTSKIEKTVVKKEAAENKMAEMTALKANSDIGYTRIVLELKNRQPSWEVNYDKDQDILELTLPNTKNKIKNSVINQKKGAVLKNITIKQSKTGSLKLLLHANQAVQHNMFVLDKPERLVVDLFTNYSQKLKRKITDDIDYTQWDRSIGAGRLRVYIVKADTGAKFIRESKINYSTLEEWNKQVKSEVLIPLDDKDYYGKGEKWYLNKNSEGWNLFKSKDNDANGLKIAGISILENGKYTGPKGSDGEISRPSATFLGVDNNGNLVTVLIEGGLPASVGASLMESAEILAELGVKNALCIARGKQAQWILQGKILPIEMTWPKEKYNQIISIK